MKLLTVGSSSQSNIYFGSPYVSGYHADIVILDNGDVMICDKGSTNGTFLNGTKLTPNVEVLVRRGDNVLFADTSLDWSLVPEIRPEANVQKLIGIGTHQRNQIRLSGQKVSRFHATIKQTNDGKWFISDHSTNGTTVNNVRIPRDTFVRLKAKDVIKCAGVPVNNPIPQNKGLAVLRYCIAAVLACLLILGGWLWYRSSRVLTPQQVYAKYAPSTVLIMMGYHYKISAGTLDVQRAFGADEFVVIDNELVPFTENMSQRCFATGFYISDDGLIATNLHVARPWLFDKTIQPVEDLVRVWLNDLSKSANSNYANYISQVKVDGVVDYIYAISHGEYFDGHNAMSCMEVTASDDTEIDLAILKAMLPGQKLQNGASSVKLSTIPGRESYKPGVKLYTVGFPEATRFQDVEKKTLKAIFAEGHMSNSNNNYDFGHSANATNGSSGSPVFNNKGELIGVISSGLGNGYNFAVRAEYINQLLEKAQLKNNL